MKYRTSEDFETHRKLYNVWSNMKQRINNPNATGYARWGGRGIKFCEEWQDFSIFETWALSNGYECGKTLDRIDNNGNYEPSNCRWVSNKENSKNRSTTRFIEIEGEKMTVSEIVEKHGINEHTIRSRLQRGITGKALIKPTSVRHGKDTTTFVAFNGQVKSFIEWAEETGIPYGTLKSRYRRGDREEKLFRPLDR